MECLGIVVEIVIGKRALSRMITDITWLDNFRAVIHLELGLVVHVLSH